MKLPSPTLKHVPSDVVVEGDDMVVVLVFEEAICAGDGVLGISFSGVLNEHRKGFYRGSYMDGEVKKNMVVTQFEAASARLCFPCWDEPALKATFKVTVGDIPVELTALSNMPIYEEKINEDLKTVFFEESPLMSTYLVALVVGLFDYIEDATADGIKVRAYCPVGQSEKGKLALDIAVKALEFYTNYFSVSYPLPKLDMVAVKDFEAGAMENYGLIVYREVELLYEDLQSTAANKQRLVIVTAHEVAHQWFGNLVTMEWWTDIWLNEGFATWISYLATNTLYPEWNIWNNFLEESMNGLRMDALEQSHPIEVEIPNVSMVDDIFDSISYQKGSSVITMLQDYLGCELFQKSISAYIKRYACKNAKTEKLWSTISEESGIQVNKIMEIWTKQKGYPVISAKSKNGSVEFEQSQFLYSGSRNDNQWIVPITVSLGSYEKRIKFLLETKDAKLDVPESKENLWIKVNVGQTGFYRVKYDDELAARLRKAIKDDHLSAADTWSFG